MSSKTIVLLFVVLLAVFASALTYRQVVIKERTTQVSIEQINSQFAEIRQQTNLRYKEIMNRLISLDQRLDWEQKKTSQVSKTEENSPANVFIKELIKRVDELQTQINEMLLTQAGGHDEDDDVAGDPGASGSEHTGPEQMESIFREEQRRMESRANELETAFTAEPSNTVWGSRQQNDISVALNEIKGLPQFDNINVSGVDCRSTQCKVGIFYQQATPEMDMVILELLTRLDGAMNSVQINQDINDDGSVNAVYYLSK